MADTEQQQVTSKTPATKQKNPKRVAAGKAVAERTRIAREKQKNALIELQAKQAEPSAEPKAKPTKKWLTTSEWLTVISIGVSLVGLGSGAFYKRKEIRNFFTKKDDPPPPAPPQSPVLPRAPPARIRQMD